LKRQNQQISNNSNTNSIKPEIAKALEETSVKGKAGTLPRGRKKALKAEPATVQINLSDSEFGKY
jgi:hypothetical protein